jgi:carboxyl-terminal processing protease
MKRVFFVIISLFTALLGFAQNKVSSCDKIEQVIYLAQKMHVQPPTFNKDFAVKVIENFIFSIDGQGIVLYDHDIIALQNIQYRESNPEEIFCKSLAYISKTFHKRLSETDSIYASFTKNKMQWIKNDSLLYYDSFNNNYSKNKDQKVKRIEQAIKLSILNQLALLERLNKDFEFEKNDSIKQKIIQKNRKSIANKIGNGTQLDDALEEKLLRAIISNYDPHSDFFTAKEKSKFKESLATSAEKYGFYFEENKRQHIEIAAIQPGSPAWKCNKLNVGDEVIKIKFANKKAIDLNDFDIDEFNELISTSTEDELIITVLKKTGATEEVHLKKAEIKIEENSVNAYILTKENKIGYISLPSFYTDFNENSAQGCANDVAKEIIKLKEESIEGLILDLRNNGGGSVEEAINLAGIFIDAAPLYIEKIRDLKPKVIKDMNRGSIYDGPLVVIINKGSASASELLAQMLKTQNRAIIVGSTSYGKASGQIVIPLDTTVNLYNLAEKNKTSGDFIKITVEKLYDLSGTTYQKTGVVPHIAIPDLWSSYTLGEAKYTNALPADVIEKKVPVTTVPDAKISTCATLSNQRIQANAQFKRCISLGDTIQHFYNYTAVPLHPQAYKQLVVDIQKVDQMIDDIFAAEDSLFVIKPTQHNTAVMQMDEVFQSIIADEINNLSDDMILKETYSILADYLKN